MPPRYNWRDGYTPRRKREKPMEMSPQERLFCEAEIGALIQRLLVVRPSLAVSVVLVDLAPEADKRAMAYGNLNSNTQRQLFRTLAGVPDDDIRNERDLGPSQAS